MPLELIGENIPKELQTYPQWLKWRERKLRSGKRAKLPEGRGGSKEWQKEENYFTFEEVESNGHAGIVLSPKYLALDFDDVFKGDKLPDEVQALVREIGSYAERSVSGEGIHILVKGDWDGPDAEFQWKGHRLQICKRFLTMTGRALNGTRRIKKVKLNELITPDKDKKEQPAEPGQRLGPEIEEGKRNSTLHRVGASMRAKGKNLDDIINELLEVNAARCRPLLSTDEVKEIARSAHRYRVNPKRNSIADFQEMLGEQGFMFRWNEFTARAEMKDTSTGLWNSEWVMLDDMRQSTLLAHIDREIGYRPTTDCMQHAVADLSMRSAFHPIKNYLNGLKWDGIPRLAQWLITYGEAADNALNRAIGRMMLVAAVRRVMEPGAKYDMLVVLVGKQGIGKSTMIRSLVPEVDWFSDRLDLASTESRTVIEQSNGKWIIEASELAGVKRSEVERLKNFLSSPQDVARLSYRRNPQTVPRQFVVFGSTNSHDFLYDSSGNRRFAPVEVTKCDYRKVARDRDQLWAEAVEVERKGTPLYLGRVLETKLATENENYAADDPWQDIIDTVFGKKQEVNTSDLWKVLRIEASRQDPTMGYRLRRVMEKAGFKKARLRAANVLAWGWKRA